MSNRLTTTFTTGCLPTGADVVSDQATCGPTDVNCNDPVFAANNPDLCGANQLFLRIKPEMATLVVGLTMQYSTVAVVNGVETALTLGLSYKSSNVAAATINATSGLATSVAAGTTIITATWHGLTVTATLTTVVVCGTAAMVILLDDSKSMSLPFGGGDGPPTSPTNNGVCGAALLTETFEGANSGYDLVGWVASGTVNPNYATSPMQGAQGLRIHTDDSRVSHSFTQGFERCLRLRLRMDVLPSADTVLASLGDDAGDVCILHIDATGHLRLEAPGSAFSAYTTDGLVAGTNYFVRVHYRGTPGDPFASVEFATGSFAFTNAGTKYVSQTGFTDGFDVNSLILGVEPVASINTGDVIYDDITVSDYSSGGVSGGGSTGGGPVAYNSRLEFAKAAAARLISDADFTNSSIGIVRFNTAVATQALSTSEATLLAYVAATPQTTANTGIGEALQSAVTMLSASAASQKAIVVLSDGEQRLPSSVAGLDPATVAEAFKATGGIILTCGARASGGGYTLLQNIATGGYFLNALASDVADVLNLLSGLRGYFCAGTCEDGVGTLGCLTVPPGDQLPDPSPLEEIEIGVGGSFTFTASCTKSCPPNQIGDPVTKSATYTSTVSPADAESHATAAACAAAQAELSCCSNGPISIIDPFMTGTPVAPAVPYPACYKAQGLGNSITSLSVRIYGFTHTYPYDVSFLLEGPTGVTVLLMSGAGGGNSAPASNVNLIFQDGASAVPGSAAFANVSNEFFPIASGTYRPTYYGNQKQFPSPAHTLPYSITLANYIGTNPNGLWKLYVTDDINLDIGSIASWDLLINATEPGCHCTDDAVVRIPSYAAVLATLSLCGTCDALGAGTQWDGTIPQIGAGTCFWYASGASFPRIGTAVAFKAAVIEFLTLPNGECTYELRIYCDHAGLGDASILIWAGRRSDSLSPTGTYTRVNIDSAGETPCSATPPTIDIVT